MVDSYVSLGDAETIIEFQDLSEFIQKDEPKLNYFLECFVDNIGAKIRDSTDVETFEGEKISLRKRILPTKNKMDDLQNLLKRVVNDTVKSQINVILGKWA